MQVALPALAALREARAGRAGRAGRDFFIIGFPYRGLRGQSKCENILSYAKKHSLNINISRRLIFFILILMFLIGYFIKPVIFNNYPWLYEILKLYGLNINIILILLWVLILYLDSALELIIYNIYKKNNAKIKFQVIIEWLINSRYRELWDQSQSTLKNEHNKFYIRNYYFHLFILFIILIILLII